MSAHDHGHGHGPRQGRRLAWTLALAAGYMITELIGGLWSNSLALLADAGHMLSDVAALALALVALWIGSKPPTVRRTFGFRRAEVLAAVANAVGLVVIAVFIFIEAFQRFSDPPEITGWLMFSVAIGGLVVNIVGLLLLHGGREGDLNLRGAWLHVLGDTLGSLGAIASALCVWLWGWTWADPAASVLIAALVVISGASLLKEATDVLMEAAPGHIDPEELARSLTEVAGVEGLHDLHVWSLTGGKALLTAHVEIADPGQGTAILATLSSLLMERFGIDHSTIQLEANAGDGRCAHGLDCAEALS